MLILKIKQSKIIKSYTKLEQKMKKTILLLVFSILFIQFANAQEKSKLPDAKVKDLQGNTVSTSTFRNDGKPVVISFWATWCKPCMEEMAAINELFAEWKEETGVRYIAVSIDDSRSSRRVAPLVKSKGWEFEVYLDDNQDFKRAMNVNNPPHTFLLDGDGQIVFEHNGYAPGDEKKLYQKIKEISKK